MSDLDVELMTAPTSPTDESFPVWTDLVDNWRAIDAHWLRNRSVQIFPDATARNTALGGSAMKGMLSYLDTTPPAGHPGGPDFYDGSAWQSVRYPNLNVTSDATSVTLRQVSAGSGISLLSDGSVNIAKAFIGTGGIGSTLDNTGIAVKVGTKTVKLATDTTALTVDSPVKVTGNIDSTGTITGAVVTAPTINSSTTINAAAITASGTVQGNVISGGTAQAGPTGEAVLVYESSQARMRHKSTGASAWLGMNSSGALEVKGASIALNGPVTASAAATFQAASSFQARPTVDVPGKVSAGVAMVMVSSTDPGSTNAPDGTIWFKI